MGFLLFDDGSGVTGPSYYSLVEYVIGLSTFMVVWVLVVLAYQIFCHLGVGSMSSESYFMEFIWTFFPILLVFMLSVLNLFCLTVVGEFDNFKSVKVVGRQWYWSYGLTDEYGDEAYDSVMSDFVDGVNKPLRLCGGNVYRFCVTSADVIHSFSIPFMTLKVDAMPGRVNQVFLAVDCCGRYVGYCSELCGAGHAYMPMVIEVVPGGAF